MDVGAGIRDDHLLLSGRQYLGFRAAQLQDVKVGFASAEIRNIWNECPATGLSFSLRARYLAFGPESILVKKLGGWRRAWLLAIVALASGVAMSWLVRVPFFQNPDEAAHADYAFAIFDAKKFARVDRATPTIFATRQARYLAHAARYRELRYNVRGRLPRGYGSLSYFRAIDEGAPRTSGEPISAGGNVPYVMFGYPPLYYITIALVMSATAALTHDSLVAAFFAARGFGIACSIACVLLAYGIFRELRVRSETALVAVAAFAFLPLSTQMAASVQPDTLAAVLVNATLFASLRIRNGTRRVTITYITLLASIVSLAFVKLHYTLGVAVPVFMLLATHRSNNGAARWKDFALAGGYAAIVIAAVTLSPRSLPVSVMHLPDWAAAARPGSAIDHFRSFAVLVWAGFVSNYLNPNGLESFWIKFGVRAGSVYGGLFARVVLFVLATLSCMTIILFAMSRYATLLRIRVVASRSGILRASSLVAGDVVLNTYLLTTAILFAVFALTDGQLQLQGRYWYVVLVPTLALSIVSIPKFFQPRLRSRISFGFALGWALFAVISAPLGIAARERDYYSARSDTPKHELGEISGVRDDRGRIYDPSSMRVDGSRTLRISGWVIDAERGLPPLAVRVNVDGAPVPDARVGRRTYEVYRTFNDPLLMDSGFEASIPLDRLSCGAHEIVVRIPEKRAPGGLEIGTLAFFVDGKSCG